MNIYAIQGHSRQCFADSLPDGHVQMLYERPSGFYIANKNGEWELDLPKLREQKKEEILSHAEQALSLLTSEYSEFERQTFPRQEAAARAILENLEADNIDTAFLRRLADAENVEITTYARRVLSKASALALSQADILTKLRDRELQINNAETVAEIEKISPCFDTTP